MSPCRYRGRPNATIDALAMTVLSRSKNAASIDGSISAPLPAAPPPVMVPHPFPLRPVPTRPGRVPLLFACWSPKGGSGTTVVAAALAASATVSLLVIRPCYLALRRALDAPLRPSGVVLVSEEGRSLGRADVEDVLGVPVRAEIRVDPAVARAVDAALLAGRLPRGLERALRPALDAGGSEAA